MTEGMTKKDTKRKNIVIVDIDGTMANINHRIHHIRRDPKDGNPKDYKSFHLSCVDDKPIPEMIDLVQNLMFTYTIIFCTGRPEYVRNQTEKWLKQQGLIVYNKLLMRENTDHRHDIIVKPEMLLKANIDLDSIAFILEDRNGVVKKWRSMGLRCLQVSEGKF